MIDPLNNGNLVGGIVADPELVNDNKILRLRIGVDRAGNDRINRDNDSGYFNVTYFLNNDDPNTKFVRGQLEKGNLKKGSQVHILYRLVQDRWEQEGNKRSAVSLIAESLTYAGTRGTGETKTTTASGGETQKQAEVPTEF